MIKKIYLLLLILPSFVLGQHSIKGTFSPADSFNFAILYKVSPTTSIYIANAEISEQGVFMFDLDSTVTEGMYRVVYALPQEEYNFDIIYNAKEDIVLEFNLDEGVKYTASKENILLTSYHKSINLISEKINQFYSQETPSEDDFKTIFDILKQTQTEFESAAEGTIALAFIKASRPYIPNNFEDVKTFSKNFKNAYFEPIDFGNRVLQNSNFLIETTLNYVFSFIDQKDENKAFKSNIDNTVKAIGAHPVIKKILLETLWNQFAQQQNETVANYIATTYLLDLAISKNDKDLIKILTQFKAISIGETAPDFQIEIKNKEDKIELKNLSELKLAKSYIIVFWSSTCSHCLDELPKLKTYVSGLNEVDLKVIAIGLEDEPYSWKDKTYDFPSFIHVYGDGKWDNKIGNDYAVDSTPTYFLLDQDKKIIGKPYDFEAFKVLMDAKSIKN